MTERLYKYIAALPFNKRISVVMALVDITPKELAYEAGLSLYTVYGYRNANNRPTEEGRKLLDEIISDRVPLLKGLLLEI